MDARKRVAMITGLLVGALCGAAQAQERLPVIPDFDMLNREINARLNADKICWTQAEPVAADWVARQDPGYRRDVFSRYFLEEIKDGWRWFRRDGSQGNSIRATSSAQVEGLTESELEAHHGKRDRTGWAQFSVQGPLSNGKIRFEWTVPPERICMADGLRLEAVAEVVEGNPGSQGMVFIVPLSKDQMRIQGREVKACSPGSSTAVDSEIGITRDEGTCKRPLDHMSPDAKWSIWVSLPESFYVVYPYEPDVGELGSRRQ